MKEKQRQALIKCKEDMMHMWRWLSENPGKMKHNYRDEFDTLLRCAACDYDDDWAGPDRSTCSVCPIDWWCGEVSSKFDPCTADGSPYDEWDDHVNACPKYAAVMAREVYKLAIRIKIPEEESNVAKS